MAISPQTLIAWIDAVGWTLLHFLWQGAALGIAYRAARPLCRDVAARYRLGMGFLAALLACPLLTMAWLHPSAVAAAAGAPAALPGVTIAGTGAVLAGNPAIEVWLPWIVAAWLVGALAIAARAFAHWRRLNWLVRHASIALPDCADMLATLCRRFGVSRPVRLLGSLRIDTPMLVGWLRPVILLPISMLSGFTPQQIELIIAHELGHVRRWDYLANLLQVVIETVLFYHPVVHWISRDVRESRESCCDDLVLALAKGSPVVYASTLADLEQLRHDHGHGPAAPALAASGGVLLERVRRIVGAQSVLYDPLPRSGGWPIALLTLVGVAVVMQWRAPAPDLAQTLRDAPAASIAAISGNPKLLAPAASQPVPSPAVAAPLRALPQVPESIVVKAPAEPVVWQPVARPRIAVAAEIPAAAGVRDIRETLATLAPAVATVEAEARVPTPVALQRVQPDYPRHEKLRGVTGEVELEFAIDASGGVGDIRVLRSTPENVFDSVSIAALKQWRFAPGSTAARYTQSFAFALGTPPADSCREVTGSHICRHTAPSEDDADGLVRVVH